MAAANFFSMWADFLVPIFVEFGNVGGIDCVKKLN